MSFAPEAAFPGRATLGRWRSKASREVSRALDGRKGLLCVVFLVLAVPYVASVDWPEVARALASARPSYPADPTLLAEARRLALDYETVARDPSAHFGRPVEWCIYAEAFTKRVFVGGNTGWVVTLEGNPLDLVQGVGRCTNMLAIVEKAAVPGVHLRFAGRP